MNRTGKRGVMPTRVLVFGVCGMHFSRLTEVPAMDSNVDSLSGFDGLSLLGSASQAPAISIPFMQVPPLQFQFTKVVRICQGRKVWVYSCSGKSQYESYSHH